MTDFLASEAMPRSLPELTMDESLFPTRIEIEQCLRQVKPRKAAGLDCLPGDVLRIAAKPFARLLEPLFFKSVAFVRQPVQWRGGVLVSAWKGAGPTEQVSSYRSLFVGSAVGKTYHRLVRNKAWKHTLGRATLEPSRARLTRAPPTWLLPMSSGPIPLGTAPLHFSWIPALRTIEWSERQPQGCESLGTWMFVSQRYCSTLRCHPVHGTRFLPLSEVEGRCGRPERHSTCARLRKTFFITQFASRKQVSRTRAGSRPGESMADVVFSVIYHQVLCQIRREADVQGLVDPLEYDGVPSLWRGDTGETLSLMD